MDWKNRLALALILVLPVGATAQEVSPGRVEAPIASLLGDLSEDVREFEEHVVTLANPFMEGRVPGSRGMQIAKEYVEYYFRQAGLEPAFETGAGAGNGYRQPFPLGSELKVGAQHLELPGSDVTFRHGRDFTALGLGTSGEITAPLVFVGYGIDRGRRGYSSFGEGTDLTGKIAVALRFEPMNEEGRSRWGRRSWSAYNSLGRKVRAAVERNAAGLVIINPPGCADPRAKKLIADGSGGRQSAEFPVLMLSTAAGEKLIADVEPERRSLLELRQLADEGGECIELQSELTIRSALDRIPLMAENVGALLPGRGALAEEIVVVGAHLDHLGMGNFGSRSGPGTLHPGADDNASGTAGIIMLGRKLAEYYKQLPPDTPARTLLFLAFSGEESGLNGSAYYAANPIRPIEKHALMINFDMIGRIKNNRLSVSGTGTAEGMSEWLQPLFDECPLDIVARTSSSGGSDHMSFNRRRVPVLFGIITPLHPDYHTPQDVSWKINRVGGVQTIQLFEKILTIAATRTQNFTYAQPAARSRANANAGGRSRLLGARRAFTFGVRASATRTDVKGVVVRRVVEGSQAENAGLKSGDVIVSWAGKEVTNNRAWQEILSAQKSGQECKVGVERDGAKIELKAQLPADRRP